MPIHTHTQLRSLSEKYTGVEKTKYISLALPILLLVRELEEHFAHTGSARRLDGRAECLVVLTNLHTAPSFRSLFRHSEGLQERGESALMYVIIF